MATLHLAGKTRAGRNHVANHGTRWQQIAEEDSVMFSPRPGPWRLLESLADVEAGKGQAAFLLWVHGESDADHAVVENA